MRLELESRVDCTDETSGELVDVVIDPTSRSVTHLVVEPDRDPWRARLVPVERAQRNSDASWDVGIEDVPALPYYSAYDLEPEAFDYAASYDRIPTLRLRKDEVAARQPVAVRRRLRPGEHGTPRR